MGGRRGLAIWMRWAEQDISSQEGAVLALNGCDYSWNLQADAAYHREEGGFKAPCAQV